MNRALYSGVSGLKAHQTKMDVIGNNIANVNTYGFKSSRVTFRDVYYQALSAGSSGSSTSGGTNSSSIGYGATVGSVDLLMGQSSFTMTGKSTDLAIDGEGFFQVQDADGNTYYTRAGTLSFDSAGNLVDSNGNFVLGISGNPLGQKAGNNLIQLNLPSVTPSASSVTTTINDIKYTLSTSNYTDAGNITMQIIQDTGMTDGVRAMAEVGTNSIVVTLNANETFGSLDDLNNAINDAINTFMLDTTGSSHPAGTFSISMDPSDGWPSTGLTGEEICSTDFSLQSGEAKDWPTATIGGGFSPAGETGSTFGAAFTGDGDLESFNVEYVQADNAFTVTMTIDGQAYTGTISSNKASSGTMKLTNTTSSDSSDYIVVNRPSFTTIQNTATSLGNSTDNTLVDTSGNLFDGGIWNCLATAGVTTPSATTFTAAAASNALGLSSNKITLSGGTKGGSQGVESLTGISVGADGTIIATHPELGDVVVGRVSLVTFANPEGMVQSGGTYFLPSANSGDMGYCDPGANGSGELAPGSLELSNVDLSTEFADMITTERGYQACSRLITVSDEMLEELVNLKR